MTAPRMLARPVPTDDLPFVADNLLRYRQGLPRLRRLAAATPPAAGLDLGPALAWLRDAVETLELVEPLADRSALERESVLVPGHDAEYGAAASGIGAQIAATLQAVVPAARALGTGLRTAVIEAADPARLPAEDQAIAWQGHSTALAGVATVDRRGAGLREAALICQDAALALLQARAVRHAGAALADDLAGFFTYERPPVSIWADGRWWGVQEYHASRGLPRTWTEGARAARADIRRGDVVRIRRQGIVLVESVDRLAGRLGTIAGVGRPSLVDFEEHVYGTLPVAAACRLMSPAEIQRRGFAYTAAIQSRDSAVGRVGLYSSPIQPV